MKSFPIIVPLAGADFVRDDGKVKGEVLVDGQPLLLSTLQSRPWYKDGDDSRYIFVFMDSNITRSFARLHLSKWFPNCQTIFLSGNTRGAALSTLSALSLVRDFNVPIIVDLADIYYEYSYENFNFEATDLGAIALTFKSKNPKYSYLAFNSAGNFLKAKEKEVVSNNASAGTYIFRNFSILVQSIGLAVEDEENQTFNDLFYVCPLYNQVKLLGFDVLSHPVKNVKDIKIE